jgi:hypothetical protein
VYNPDTMFGDGSITLREFAMREQVPLASIQEEILESLRNRADAVLFGAQAVNAYVDEARMTQDVDILSTRAAELADELRDRLADKFRIAVRVRVVAQGQGFRVYQLREPKNRHLADVLQVSMLPPAQPIAEVLVPTPEVLLAQKVIALTAREGQPKADTDRRDIKMLLLALPDLKHTYGAVRKELEALEADRRSLEIWEALATSEIAPETDDY